MVTRAALTMASAAAKTPGKPIVSITPTFWHLSAPALSRIINIIVILIADTLYIN